MKRNVFGGLVWGMLLLVSCSDNETVPDFTVESDGEEITLEAAAGASSTLRFTSTDDWQAKVNCDWIDCSPSSGRAGTHILTVTATTENTDVNTRTATLTLSSGKVAKNITILQEAAFYVHPEQDMYSVPAAGGLLTIVFTTNVNDEELMVYGSGEPWVTQAAQGRSESTYSVELIILENSDSRSRTSYVSFYKESGKERTLLNYVTILQEGTSSGESTDYSADKTVRVLQQAEVGNGIPIVLMGDGFIDTEIADGTYDAVMEKALENLFTEEPLASLRPYFDIYSVTAVSKNNNFGTGYETVFGCELAGGNSTFISGDDEMVMDYVEMVDGINLTDALAVVVLNTPSYAGTTYFGYQTQKGNIVEFAIAYCPVIYNAESESFREVLVHEAMGHGFAKLEDEYSYESNGTIPSDEIETVKYMQTLGWALNVDFTADPDKVLWTTFLSDSRYTSEGLGIFEGACTYIKGVYRSSENSMMNTNTCGFNAPSRKAIYEMVLKRGTGTEPSYEDFVTFDRQLQGRGATGYVSTWPGQPFARPQWANKTIHGK